MSSLQVAILGFGVLAAAAALLASLWENPRAGRSPRQRRGGIFHRLRAMLPRFACLERAAAWWILRVVNPPADASFDFAWRVGLRFWPRYAQAVADFVQVWLVPSLLLDFLAWPFAYDFLLAKRNAEETERGQS